jgi:phenylpropionate dioxygenase-like ring-hydroxylating dioxygenase large terminal subunit
LFNDFANVWTPITLSRRVKKKPVAITLAGEKLVLFRNEKGELGALLDRCPHRGVALSLGKIEDDGCISCPFHGWRFDTHGAATHIPLNPDAKRERLFARSIPVRELGDVIWGYTAVVSEAPTEPNLPPALVDSAMARTLYEVDWACHWTRAMENMLDSPHLPFVHATTIGRSMKKRMTKDSRIVMTWEETPWGGRQRSSLDGDDSGGAHLDYYRPNIMALHIPIPNKRMAMHALVVPVDDTHTRLIVVGARDFMTARFLNPLFNKSNAIIAAQDKEVVESSFPVEVPPAAQELSVASDKPTLQFRKYYFESLKGSSAKVPSREPQLSAAPDVA